MFAAQHIPYAQTNRFTKIVLDYLQGAAALRPFYLHAPSLGGIKQAIENRKAFPTNRKVLVEVLKEQYASVNTTPQVQANIDALLNENAFTFCTAHQPNILTGPLYFIYKILHVIRLAEEMKKALPHYQFVPVFYMGSEDADFAELNHIYVGGKKYEWKTQQAGAVGRMLIDKAFVQLIEELKGQLAVEPYGDEFIQLLKQCYRAGITIQQATLEMVNALFGEWGLLVLVADDARLKRQMLPVFEEDIFQQKPSVIVEETGNQLGVAYNVQAHPREINLFYLKDNLRERIEKKGDHFVVLHSSLSFTEDELRAELTAHPERFSPNVILRGLYQETILPNLAFVGGGGELAYWLQLKNLFQTYGVPYPVLVLRNSFMLVEEKWKAKMQKLGFAVEDFFCPEEELMKRVVEKYSSNTTSLNGNFEKAESLFESLKEQASAIDPTLSQHVAALKTRSLKDLQELEKKMLRAEKRKFADEQRQIQTIRNHFFPGNGLQERKENIAGFYAQWGRSLLQEFYKHSFALEQEFVILTRQTD